jgi:hypothetical protein
MAISSARQDAQLVLLVVDREAAASHELEVRPAGSPRYLFIQRRLIAGLTMGMGK